MPLAPKLLSEMNVDRRDGGGLSREYRDKRQWRAHGSGFIRVRRALFRRTLATNAPRLLAIMAGLLAKAVIMPVIFNAYGREQGDLVETEPLLKQFSEFGGADFFTLAGAVATGFVHPFTLLLMGIMAVGYPALGIAGERGKGTLEVTLARPISRRGLFGTLFGAGVLFLGALVAVYLVATVITVTAVGLVHELDLGLVLQLWVGGVLLFAAFMSLTFWISVLSDRSGPAIGIPAVFILINYFAFIVGSIWPDARLLEEYSMFNLLKAQDILESGLALSDALVMVGFSAIFVAAALYAFPRRDLPAPS
jgi:ABC-2 type transport system permease protein